MRVRKLRQQPRERGFPDARRPEKDGRGQAVALQSAAKRSAGANEMALPGEFVKRARAQTRGERQSGRVFERRGRDRGGREIFVGEEVHLLGGKSVAQSEERRLALTRLALTRLRVAQPPSPASQEKEERPQNW